MIWTLLLERGEDRFVVCIKDAVNTEVAVQKATELVRDAVIPEEAEDESAPYILTYEFPVH
jgi:hypothetical protein